MNKRVARAVAVVGLLSVASASWAQQSMGPVTLPSPGLTQITSGRVLLPVGVGQSYGGVIPFGTNLPVSGYSAEPQAPSMQAGVGQSYGGVSPSGAGPPSTVYGAGPPAPYVPPAPGWASTDASVDQGGYLPQGTGVVLPPARPWPQGGATMAQVKEEGTARWTAPLSGLLSRDYTNASGTVSLWLDPAGALRYQVEVADLRNVMEITISLKDADLPPEAAAPVASLYSGRQIGGRFSGMIAQGTLTEKGLAGWLRGYHVADLIQGLDNRQAFVTVRTAQHPQGELMGDVSPVSTPRPARQSVQAGTRGKNG